MLRLSDHRRSVAAEYDSLLEALDTWFTDINALGETSTLALDDVMGRLDQLVKTL